MSEKQEDKIVLTLDNEVNQEETATQDEKVSEEEALASRVTD